MSTNENDIVVHISMSKKLYNEILALAAMEGLTGPQNIRRILLKYARGHSIKPVPVVMVEPKLIMEAQDAQIL